MFWVLQRYFAYKLETRRAWRQMKRDGLVPKDYTLRIAAMIFAVMLAFTVAFCAWWTGALAEEAPKPLTLATVTLKSADGALNVRTEPSLDSRVLLMLANGAVVAIVGECDGWALVSFPRMVGVREPMGWVWMEYLTVQK